MEVKLSAALSGFLVFETKVFGDAFPIAHYDPYLIRYGEYEFALEQLGIQSGDRVLDVGCESNIFMIYLASLDACVHGVDLASAVWTTLRERIQVAERVLQRHLAISFKAEDATNLSVPSNSFDKAIAISSIEHMYSSRDNGDQMAVASIARALKPGGVAVITVPMSNGAPFHESPEGDAQFAGPYRLYTPESLNERFLSHPEFETVAVRYLAQTTPDSRYSDMHFFLFWMNSLTPAERKKWAWATPLLATVFNPIISHEEGVVRRGTVNTALICLRKKE